MAEMGRAEKNNCLILFCAERQTSPAPDYSEERLPTTIPHRPETLEDKAREGVR